MSLTDKITQKMMPLATAICENKHLTSLRDGFMVAFPATMFASIMMIIQNLPATFGFDKFLPDGFITFLNDFSANVGFRISTKQHTVRNYTSHCATFIQVVNHV